MAFQAGDRESIGKRLSVSEQLDVLSAIIREEGDVDPTRLSQELGVSLRTVYRYLRRLKQSDLLITSYSRRQKRHIIQSQDAIRPIRLSPEEALAIEAACCNSERLSRNRLTAPLADGLKRIQDASDHAIDANASRWLDEFQITDDHVRRNIPAYYHTILTLMQAYTNRHKVRLKYCLLEQNTAEELVAHPLHVGVHKGTWYLMAFSERHGETHLFQVSLISEVNVMVDRFRKPSKMDAQARFQRCIKEMPHQTESQILLRFSAKVAPAIKQLNGIRLHIDQEMADGCLLCSLEPYGSGELMPWILGWGIDVEVLQPEGFRKDLARIAATLLRRYGAALNS